MSRGYRVSWVSASGRVEGEDALSLSLCLLNILDAGEMDALLREELAAAGWSRDGRGALTRELSDGVTATLAPGADAVVATATTVRKVSAQGTDAASAEAALREAEAREQEDAKARSARRLAAIEPELRGIVGEAVQRVYVRALKQKAASMGTVESVREGTDAAGEYEVTIKVRV